MLLFQLTGDLTQNYSEIEEDIQKIEETVGPVYMLVNCIGQAVCNKFDCAPDSDFRYSIVLL